MVVRNRPDLVKVWTAEEVATRCCTLFPKRDGRGVAQPPSTEAIESFVSDSDRVDTCRERLGDGFETWKVTADCFIESPGMLI